MSYAKCYACQKEIYEYKFVKISVEQKGTYMDSNKPKCVKGLKFHVHCFYREAPQEYYIDLGLMNDQNR